jgi:hypothetical protein
MSGTVRAAYMEHPELLDLSATEVIATLEIDCTEQTVYNVRREPAIVELREGRKASRDAAATEAAVDTAKAASSMADKAIEASNGEEHPRVRRFRKRAAKAVDEVVVVETTAADMAAVRTTAKADKKAASLAGAVATGEARVVAKAEKKAEVDAAQVPSRGIMATLAVPFTWMWNSVLRPVCTFTSRIATGWHARKVSCDNAGSAFYQFLVTSKLIVILGTVAALAAFVNAAYLTLLYVSLTWICFRGVWHGAMYAMGAFTAAEAGYRHAETAVSDRASKVVGKSDGQPSPLPGAVILTVAATLVVMFVL